MYQEPSLFLDPFFKEEDHRCNVWENIEVHNVQQPNVSIEVEVGKYEQSRSSASS